MDQERYERGLAMRRRRRVKAMFDAEDESVGSRNGAGR